MSHTKSIARLFFIFALLAILFGCGTTPPPEPHAVIQTVDYGPLVQPCPKIPHITKAQAATEDGFLEWQATALKVHAVCPHKDDELIRALKDAGLAK